MNRSKPFRFYVTKTKEKNPTKRWLARVIERWGKGHTKYKFIGRFPSKETALSIINLRYVPPRELLLSTDERCQALRHLLTQLLPPDYDPNAPVTVPPLNDLLAMARGRA